MLCVICVMKAAHLFLVLIPTLIFGSQGAWELMTRDNPWPPLFYFVCGWIVIGGFGVEAGLHRYFSHRHFTLSPLAEKFLTILSIPAGQNSPLFWSSIHRQHHQYSDSAKDPHTPQKGFFFAFFGWYYRKVKIDRFLELPNQQNRSFHLFVHRYYPFIFLLIATVFYVAFRDVFLFFLMTPALFSLVLVGLVNSCNHSGQPIFARRPHQTSDQSNNIQILALLNWGLSLHNNHHAFPKRMNFAISKREFDPGYGLCRLLLVLQSVEHRSLRPFFGSEVPEPKPKTKIDDRLPEYDEFYPLEIAPTEYNVQKENPN
jgi:stearoyl-CoA desaturase (Delta-9 desaturase)